VETIAVESTAMKIPLLKLDPDLPTPRRAHDDDAGLDLHARHNTTLAPGAWASVATGVAVAIPEGHVGLVAPRSGLALRHGIGVVNAPGVVDAGYRGEIRAILINHGPVPVTVVRGERIAQLVVVPFATVDLEEVAELPPSIRGDGGFGSTGS
jgi:dUTP pyrophosphatase